MESKSATSKNTSMSWVIGRALDVRVNALRRSWLVERKRRSNRFAKSTRKMICSHSRLLKKKSSSKSCTENGRT